MPDSAVSPTQGLDWEPRDKDIKTYGHFDRRISSSKLKAIANDSKSVAKHAFLPLLLFHEEWTKFRKDDGPLKKKIRPIRYAARVDAAIYARYRAELAEKYEAELHKRGIESVPIAYRALPIEPDSLGNKSNIDFAHDAFTEIKRFGDCIVSVVDINSYFESIDHDRIKSNWELLLGQTLPPDHDAIFKSVTRYSVVDLDKATKRLALKKKNKTGSRNHARQRKIDTLRANGHLQLCSMKDFREKICGDDPNYQSLIVTNGRSFGIPQGTPISDIIANFYLLDFDSLVNDWVKSRGGTYYRYSDDIIVILPTESSSNLNEAKDFLQDKIKAFGSRLRVQDKKVVIGRFSKSGNQLVYKREFGVGGVSRNGLEFLGFSFDGKAISLKDATLSNAWRKFHRRSYGYAWRYVKRYRDKGEPWIRKHYPYKWLLRKIIQNVSYSQDTGPESWTFLRYVSRARKKFADFDILFSSQTRKYRRRANINIRSDLDKAINRHM